MTDETDDRHQVPCPHPGCNATLKIPTTLPAGEYKCICWGCLLRVSWATGVDFKRTPYAEVVEKEGAR